MALSSYSRSVSHPLTQVVLTNRLAAETSKHDLITVLEYLRTFRSMDSKIPSTINTEAATSAARRLGLFDATMIVMGGIIDRAFYESGGRRPSGHYTLPDTLVWTLGGSSRLPPPSSGLSLQRCGRKWADSMRISAMPTIRW